jgi:uncharacterized protein YcgI (DUF1989 family)
VVPFAPTTTEEVPAINGMQVVEGGTGWAGTAPAGSTLRVTDIEGTQVGDLVLFRADDPADRFSAGNTRKMAGSIFITTGATLWSTRYERLAELGEDTAGRHDLLASACTQYDYPIRFGVTGHRSCLANLTEALAPFGIGEAGIPDPMNVFMSMDVGPDGGLTILEATSKPGDHLDVRMLVDCIVALSACPQDLNDTNGGTVTDLGVEILPG